MIAERHHFVIPPEGISEGGRFRLNGEEAHHLSRVARLRVGDEVFLLDGGGNAHRGKIERIDGRAVSGAVVETVRHYHESAVKIHLGLGNLKGSKLSTVVEKGTELGIQSVTVLTMRHGVKKEVNLTRMERVAAAAMKQCGRGRAPDLNLSRSFREWCESHPSDRSMAAVNSLESHPIHRWPQELPSTVDEIWITVGPEGGFHPDEERLASHRGIPFVSLGPRRLRSETAAIAAVAACESFFSGRR